MRKYELKLRHNMESIIVGKYACGRNVNVALNKIDYKPYRWGGFIDYDAARSESKTDYVFAACLHGNNAFREVGDYEWRCIASNSAFHIVGLVDVDVVYGVTRDDEPWIVNMNQYADAALPIIDPTKPKPPPNNIYHLFG